MRRLDHGAVLLDGLHRFGPAKLAADVLLDALFLDPEASRFLEERAEMLFASGAKRLLRMLLRFEHVATVSPLVAAQVLLAAIVDDAPEERYGSRRFDDGLDLAYDQQSYPIGYWKSQFYSLLHVNAVVALEALNKLVESATDRWEHEADAPPPPLELTLSDGIDRNKQHVVEPVFDSFRLHLQADADPADSRKRRASKDF